MRKIGDRAACITCGRVIVYTGRGWVHVSEVRTSHIALPKESKE